jgi:C4-dicarboxylate-binding protein DctP
MKLRKSAFCRGAIASLTAGILAFSSVPVMAQEFVAKIGHLESQQQSRHIHLEKVAALVAERTNGAVAFQIFPQGQLGNQRQMTEGVQLGTLEATVAPAAFLGGFNPIISILDIPFLLPSDEDVAQILREGEFGEALLASFSSKGLVGVALWPNGRKNFTSNESLDSIAAFAGQKFRVMDSKILIEQFTALGASAIALPFGELYTSLQTGVIDGQENPLDTIQRMKFFEVQDYLVISEHGAMEDLILFNPSWWNSLPEEYRTIIDQAFSEVVPDLRAHKAAAVQSALDVISESDINIRTASDEERAEFRAIMYAPSADAYVERAGDEGQALLDVYEKAYAAIGN